MISKDRIGTHVVSAPKEVNGASETATGNVKTDVVTVTPKKAALWLSKSAEDQRNVSSGVVDSYTNDMHRGAWRLTHEGFAFDSMGRMIDGQHRCLAVIKSGVTIKSLRTTGLPLTMRDPINIGYRRRLDFILGDRSHREVATRSFVRRFFVDNGIRSRATPDSVRETEALFTEELQWMDGIARNSSMLPVATVRACCVYAYLISPAKIKAFWHGITTGENLEAGSPMAPIYRRIVAHENLTDTEYYTATMNALRAYFRGLSVKSVTTKQREDAGPLTARVWFDGQRKAKGLWVAPAIAVGAES